MAYFTEPLYPHEVYPDKAIEEEEELARAQRFACLENMHGRITWGSIMGFMKRYANRGS